MKFLPFWGAMSGKVAGLVVSRNKAGAYIRMWVNPVNPQTELQTSVRARFAAFMTRWKNILTETQRAGWNILAKANPVPNGMGGTQVLQGANVYAGSNAAILTAGDTRIDEAPISLETSGIVDASVTIVTDSDPVVTFAFSAPCATEERVYIKGLLDVPLSQNNVTNRLRHMFVSAKAATSPVALTIPAKFGVPSSGSKVVFEIMKYNATNGALSPGVLISKVVA